MLFKIRLCIIIIICAALTHEILNRLTVQNRFRPSIPWLFGYLFIRPAILHFHALLYTSLMRVGRFRHWTVRQCLVVGRLGRFWHVMRVLYGVAYLHDTALCSPVDQYVHRGNSEDGHG